MAMKLRTIGHKLRPSVRAKVVIPEKKADPFYLSPEWRTLMDAIIAERFGDRANTRCERAECKLPHRRGIRIFGHHVIERKDGGALFDRRNILCICGSCHTIVTAYARGERTRG